MTPVPAHPLFNQDLHLHVAPGYPPPDISSGFDVSSSLFGFCTSYHKCICSKLVGYSCSFPLNPSCWGSLPPPPSRDLLGVLCITHEGWYDLEQRNYTFNSGIKYLYDNLVVYLYATRSRHTVTHVLILTHTCIQTLAHTYSGTHANTQTHMHAYTRILAYIHAYIHAYTQAQTCTHTHTHTYIYIYIYIYVVHSTSFQTFFVQAFKIVVDSWKFSMLLLSSYDQLLWLTNFYDFRFKSTPTAGIRIHPTKAWLSQMVNFKNAIWTWGHFRKTICNKILF